MKNCICGCDEAKKGLVCETMSKCVSNIKVFIGLTYAGQTIEVTFLRHSPRLKCKTIPALVVDVQGYITIAAIDNFQNDFFFKGWTINYKYEVSAKDAVGNKIELSYNSNKFCSLVFFISSCDAVNHLINKP